ncbi:hypothetical protein ACIRF8_12720 [Streptomyces sp. NPDC102406]|uniref:hypothetical protein n=1 Tax=Streptomyces sp. NPDC102406 TaxID=3366171 RepID=UPI00380531E4
MTTAYDKASEAARALLTAFDEIQLAEMCAAQSARIRRVRLLHREEYGGCAECTHESMVSWPCRTIRAVDGEQPDA